MILIFRCRRVLRPPRPPPCGCADAGDARGQPAFSARAPSADAMMPSPCDTPCRRTQSMPPCYAMRLRYASPCVECHAARRGEAESICYERKYAEADYTPPDARAARPLLRRAAPCRKDAILRDVDIYRHDACQRRCRRAQHSVLIRWLSVYVARLHDEVPPANDVESR